jgi:antitoxin (DNA-binding transcriptional repressor) of toxin-antitoxin stability system
MDSPLETADLPALAADAATKKSRLILTRAGEPIAAIVPLVDLEAPEDATDAALAARALAKWEAAGFPDRVMHKELLARWADAK